MSDLETDLVDELRRVSQRGLRRLFETVKGTGPISTPHLDRIAYAIDQAAFTASHTEVFIQIIRHAVGQLDDVPTPYFSQVTWRELGSVLFDPDAFDDYDTRHRNCSGPCLFEVAV